MKKTVMVRGREYWRAANEFKPRAKPAFTAAQLRIIDARIDRRVNERMSSKLSGIGALIIAAKQKRGGCG